MKKKLSKIEIATYLKDYSDFMKCVSLNYEENLFEVFKNMLIENGRGQYAIKEYYFEMISVFEFFLLNKTYSFMADNLFDYILENKLSKIDIPDDIFINKSDATRFSKKQIIKFIRNAINHNDHNDKELYNLYNDNGKLKIEIHLKNVKPIPFHIELDINDYIKIMGGLWKANKIDLIYYKVKEEINFKNNDLENELDKIFYRRYYYNSKIEDKMLDKIKNQDENETINYSIERNLNSNDYYYRDYQLTKPQKLKILEDLKFWSDVLPLDDTMSIDYVVPKIVPLGINKNKQLRFSLIIADWYAKSCEKSLFDIANDARKVCLKEYDEDNMLYVDNMLEKDYRIVMRAFDHEYRESIAFSVYASYLFDTLITDENIKIGNNYYPRERIRNSFVHGRWFNGINGCYKLYDCDNGEDNELNYNWRASIPCDLLSKSVDAYYYKLLKDKDDNFLYSQPFISLDNNGKPISITFIKNDKNYILNINIDSYTDEYTPWALYNFYGDKVVYNDNKEDIDMFFEELKEALLNENPNYEHLFNFIFYQHKVCTLYKRGIIPLEELNKNDEYFKVNFIDKYNAGNGHKKK